MSVASTSHVRFAHSVALFAMQSERFALLPLFLILLLIVLAPTSAQGQNVTLTPVITTVAGNGIPGNSGAGGLAVNAELDLPGAIWDPSGNLYVSNGAQNTVFVVNPNGIISVFAGNGTAGYTGDGGLAINAELNNPHGFARDKFGNAYILDTGNNVIRKVDTNGIITTFAGTGVACAVGTNPCGDGGPASAAQFHQPVGLVIDSQGNFYASDELDYRIRKIDTSGIITTVAGNGIQGYSPDGGLAVNSEIGFEGDASVDSAGNLYYGDWYYNIIRKVDTNGILTTIAGISSMMPGYSADGTLAVNAQFNNPHSIVLDSVGNVYFADSGNNVIRKIDTNGVLWTIAGNNSLGAGYGGDSGPAIDAQLNFPMLISFDSFGNYYVSDYYNNRIRKVSQGPVNFGAANVGTNTTGNVFVSFNSNITVSNVQTSGDFSIEEASCNLNQAIPVNSICTWELQFAPSQPGPRWSSLVLTDNNSNTYSFGLEGAGIGSAAALTPGIITTVAGNGVGYYGGDGGPAVYANVGFPYNLSVDAVGNLYINQTTNSVIRKVNTNGIITTVAGNGTPGYNGDGIPATSAELYYPDGVTVDPAGNIYIADRDNYRVRVVNTQVNSIKVSGITIAPGTIATVAGNGTVGYSGDNGPALSAQLRLPMGVAVDGVGNVYIADETNSAIRMVDTSGVIRTVVGEGGGCGGQTDALGDGCPAVYANLYWPSDVKLDGAGNLYILDFMNVRVRVVNTQPAAISVAGVTIAPGTIATVAGNGTTGYQGDNGPALNAEFDGLYGLAVDTAGDIYVTDSNNSRIRKIDQNGIITTVAGSAAACQGPFFTCGDGGSATAAQIDQPDGVATDNAGNLYIADSQDNRVRKVNVSATALSFGTVNVGQISPIQDITVSDVGNATLNFSGISIPAPFQNPEVNCMPGVPVGIGQSCQLAIAFSPMNPTSSNGLLTLTDDAFNSPQSVNLSGNGYAVATFSNLTPSQTVPYGAASVNLAGVISAPGPFYPPAGETVVINIGMVWQSATIGANGVFSASFPTSTLGNGLYTITYSYAGDLNFPIASDYSTTLTISPAVPTYYTLTLSEVGTGTGSVTDSQSLINCSESNGNPETGICSANYASGAQVTLTATAVAPSLFIGWAGACASSGNNPVCTVQMTSAQSVTADFAPPPTSFTLPFNPGTNVTQMATYCPNGSDPCTDPNGHALSLSIPVVNQGDPGNPTFSLTVTATEYQADGLCPAGGNGQSSDLDCRFTSYFNFGPDPNGNTIVPLCFPYANGNCVHYQVYSGTPGNEPNTNLYSGGVFWKIGFNNDTFLPPQGSYWGSNTTVTPRLLDDPDENEVPGLPYGTVCSTPMLVNGAPTSPPIYCQFDRDITTFYNVGTGLDTTIGGKTQQPNDVVVAFLPTISNNPQQQPPAPSAPAITGASCPNGCSISGNAVTFAEGTGGTFAITFTGYPTPGLSESGPLPPGLTFSATTGLISGTPADGTTGSFPIVLTATNINGTTSQSYTLTVAPSVLTITASSATMTFRGAVPAITPSYGGFVNGDSPASLTTKPTCSTTATSTSAPGTYPSMCSGAVDPTYSMNYVNGTVTVSGLEITPLAMNFGTLYLDQLGVQAVTLTNKGTTPITISSAKIMTPGNAIGDYGDIALCPPVITVLPGTLAPGKSCAIAVGTWAVLQIFSPTAATATLMITDSAAGSPHAVPLTSMVINPQATLSSNGVNFPVQKVGTTSAVKSVTLTNTGTTTLNLATLSLNGNFALASGTTCTNGGSIIAGSSCLINLTFTPTGKGVRTGNVKITDNAMVSPQIIVLSGTGN